MAGPDIQNRCFPDALIEMAQTSELWVKRAGRAAEVEQKLLWRFIYSAKSQLRGCELKCGKLDEVSGEEQQFFSLIPIILSFDANVAAKKMKVQFHDENIIWIVYIHIDMWMDLWLNSQMDEKLRTANRLDGQAAQEISLARSQDLAAKADRLRGFTKSVRTLSLPFLRNWFAIREFGKGFLRD